VAFVSTTAAAQVKGKMFFGLSDIDPQGGASLIRWPDPWGGASGGADGGTVGGADGTYDPFGNATGGADGGNNYPGGAGSIFGGNIIGLLTGQSQISNSGVGAYNIPPAPVGMDTKWIIYGALGLAGVLLVSAIAKK
jgi:hypothetical protein